MDKFRLNINGKEVTGVPGQTILEVARENDIFIPTLCYDERTRIYGSCGICMCEVEGNPKLCKACATVIAPGMVVRSVKPHRRLQTSMRTGLSGSDRLPGLCRTHRQRRVRRSAGAG